MGQLNLPLHIVVGPSVYYFWDHDRLHVSPDMDYTAVEVDGINCIPIFSDPEIAEQFINDARAFTKEMKMNRLTYTMALCPGRLSLRRRRLTIVVFVGRPQHSLAHES